MWLRASLCLVLLPTLGCRSIDRFDTRGEAAYCGELVSAPSFHDGFLPKNKAKKLMMQLTLDTSQLSSFSENNTALPGTLSSNDGDWGFCSEGKQALFKGSPLRAIPQVYHDSLSTLVFGEGHEEDFFAWTDSQCQGTMLALVSLLRNSDVELRLFKPAPLPPLDAGPEQRPGFALFHLRRHNEGCRFEGCGFLRDSCGRR
jgi:hypothetical protein